MTELLKKLENHYVEETEKVEEFVQHVLQEALPSLLEQSLQSEMMQIQQLWKEIGLPVTPFVAGQFTSVVCETRYELHMKGYVTEERGKNILAIFVRRGFDGVDVMDRRLEMRQYVLSKEEEREQMKETIIHFLEEQKEELNRSMKKMIQSAYKYLKIIVVNGKKKMSIQEYINWASRIENETYMPMVPLYEKEWDVKSLQSVLEQTTEEEFKQKLLFSFVPMIHERWQRYHRLFGLFANKEVAYELEQFIRVHYPKEVFEKVIQGHSTNKLILRAYGLYMKEIVERNQTYKELEMFVRKVMNEKQYNIRINDSEKVKLIDEFKETKMSPSFLSFGLMNQCPHTRAFSRELGHFFIPLL